MASPPKIFHVNWFRTDEEGDFLWPGYGDNLRVLEWILARCNGEVDAVKTPIGWVPKASDLSLEGLDISEDNMNKLLEVNTKDWLKEAEEIDEFFEQFGNRLPLELKAQHEALKRRLDVLG